MTDKELLELAAKAAGIEYDAEASKPHPKNNVWFGLWLVIHSEPSEYQRRYWNPLTDDGDALRLAVKLNIVVWEYAQYKRAMAEVRYGDARGEYWELGDDPYAATRRAIVRAAAEIGKTL